MDSDFTGSYPPKTVNKYPDLYLFYAIHRLYGNE